jgi:hypothetical protein
MHFIAKTTTTTSPALAGSQAPEPPDRADAPTAGDLASGPAAPPLPVDAIPSELRDRPQWICWRYEQRDGKFTKVPYTTNRKKKADTTNPETWASFEKVYAAYTRGGFDGIGFVFSKDDDLAFIDLDHCFVDGELTSEGREIIEIFRSYTEISPSGEGLHIFALGELPADHKNKTGNYELYTENRFSTITGRRFENTSATIETRQAELEWYHDTYIKRKTSTPPTVTTTPPQSNGVAPELSDNVLLEKACTAANSQKFHRLYYRGDTSEYGGNDSSADQALCNLLAFWTRDPAKIDRLFRDSALYREEKWGARADYRERTINSALDYVTTHFSGNGSSKMIPAVDDRAPSDLNDNGHAEGTATQDLRVPSHTADAASKKLPEIDVSVKDLSIVTPKLWAVLKQANARQPFIFRHGGLWMRLEQSDAGHPVLIELTPSRLLHELVPLARYYSKGRDNTKRYTHPAKVQIEDMLATANPELPILTRITECPTFAPDGSLQTAPGYHAANQTYYAPPSGLEIPPVPASPTAADVAEAKRLVLDELLADFPFVSDADRAHLVGMGLLPSARDLIAGPTPLHMVESPMAGSGKGLAVKVTLRAGCGRNIGAIPEAHSDDEMRKKITAMLHDGYPVIQFDNLNRTLDAGSLSAALTLDTWTDRLLGRSGTVHIPIRCVWVATANNPVVSGEIARRTIRIRLDPKQDRPWQREGWRHSELESWVDEHRGQLLWANLVLIQAWVATGRPRFSGHALGSYEQWSHVIGGILEHAGFPGFLGNLAEFYEAADIETAVWRAFVAAWWEKYQTAEVGARDLFELAENVEGMDLDGQNARAQLTAFGMALSKRRDCVIGDYRLTKGSDLHRAKRWRLLPIDGSGTLV